MHTEDTNKKFRRWPPRVKRRHPRPRDVPRDTSLPLPSEDTKLPEAEPSQPDSDKSVRISYRSRRLPTRDNGGT